MNDVREESVNVDVSEQILTTVMEEYLACLERGETPNRQEYLDRFPDHADQLAAALDGLDFLGRVTTNVKVPRLADFMSPQHGESILGDFRIHRELGRGGMGIVYEAEQIHLQRRVALKVLPFAALLDETQLKRFKNEARLAAMLKHPHIVSIITVGCDRGVHYYAMELIEGYALSSVVASIRAADSTTQDRSATSESAKRDAQMLDTQSLASLRTEYSLDRRSYHRSVAQLGVQAAESLHYAHQEGVVHRDIKPGNLLLDQYGKLYVTDFGLARMQSSDDLTMTGDVVGTLRYMSPEQASGRYVDERADIYSLAATLYEMFTLQPAFPGSNRHRLLGDIVDSQPILARVHEKSIPRDLETILLRGMAKDSADRYQTMQQFAEDLQRFLEHRPIRASRQSLLNMGKKWGWRNRTAVGTTLLVTAMLCVLLATCWHREAQLRHLADIERQRAEQNYRDAQGVIDRSLGPAMAVLDNNVDPKVLHDFSSQQIADLEAGDAGTENKALQFALATSYLLRSHAAWRLGSETEETPNTDYDQAISILQELAAQDPRDRRVLKKLDTAYRERAAHLAQQLHTRACLAAMQKKLELPLPRSDRELISDESRLGFYRRLAGQLEEAERHGHRALAMINQQRRDNGELTGVNLTSQEWRVRSQLLRTLFQRNKFQEAENLLSTVLFVDDQSSGGFLLKFWRLRSREAAADLHNTRFEAADALTHLAPALEEAYEWLRRFPSNSYIQLCVGHLERSHSDTLIILGRYGQAKDALDRAVATLADAQSAINRFQLARAHLRLGQVCRHLALEEAEFHFRSAVDITRQMYGTRRYEPFCVSRLLVSEALSVFAGTPKLPSAHGKAINISHDLSSLESWQTDSGHFWRHLALAAYRAHDIQLAKSASARAVECFDGADAIDFLIWTLVLAADGDHGQATQNYDAAIDYLRERRPVSFRYTGPLGVKSLLEETLDAISVDPPRISDLSFLSTDFRKLKSTTMKEKP